MRRGKQYVELFLTRHNRVSLRPSAPIWNIRRIHRALNASKSISLIDAALPGGGLVASREAIKSAASGKSGCDFAGAPGEANSPHVPHSDVLERLHEPSDFFGELVNVGFDPSFKIV